MAYSAPRTWSAGEHPTAAQFNQDIRDNVSFLANPPSCRVFNNATQSISNNTDTAVTFNSERWDTASMHSTSSNTSRITVPVAGLYLFTGNLAFASNATGIRVCYFRVNGTDNYGLDIRNAASADVTSFSIATVIKLSASAYAELVVKQTSGGSLSTNQTSFFSPEFSATWIGLG